MIYKTIDNLTALIGGNWSINKSIAPNYLKATSDIRKLKILLLGSEIIS